MNSILFQPAQHRERRRSSLVSLGIFGWHETIQGRRTHIMLGHVRQNQDDLVFDQRQYIEAMRTHDPLDGILCRL
jgi:hypothetical protein